VGSDRNIWSDYTCIRQILPFLCSYYFISRKIAPFGVDYSAFKVQNACEPARDFMFTSGSQIRQSAFP